MRWPMRLDKGSSTWDVVHGTRAWSKLSRTKKRNQHVVPNVVKVKRGVIRTYNSEN